MSTFNVQKFYSDYDISVTTSGKHVRPGWINVNCPFCNMQGGLGIHISSGAVKCWGCGKGKSQIDVIIALLSCDFSAAKDIHDDYSSSDRIKTITGAKDLTHKGQTSECVYPTGTAALTDRHKQYLRERGFDAEHIEEVWNLRGTGNLGDYKFRIIAPIMVDGVMVSYQGRDITGKAELRYKACKQENELISHQHVVYGLDLVKGRKCLVVEGIVDTWRMGPGSVSCFGIAFTMEQVNLLAERFVLVYILFDAEEQAQRQAKELAVLLSARGVEVELLDISDTPPEHLVDPEKGIDPGNLLQWVADEIIKELEL